MNKNTNTGYGKNNKARGSAFERKIAKDLRNLGFTHAGTSRLHSRARDNAKVDICNADEDKNGRIPYNIQCKSLSKIADYPKLLSELPQGGVEINVIFHKYTKRTEAGTFRKVGEYAILELDDFYTMLQKILELEDDVKSWKQVV